MPIAGSHVRMRAARTVSRDGMAAVLLLMLMLAMAACAARREPAPHAPEKKLLVLAAPSQDPKLKPYVVNGQRYYPIPDAEGFVQYGKASWYGGKFHGRPTASGEIFDMHAMSAAHKTLPLGTWVKVSRLDRNREIVLRVNDRGPFVKGRIIDLSYGAAKAFGLVGPGVLDVKVAALGKEVTTLESPVGARPVVEIQDLDRGDFTVQVGAFRDRHNALRLVDRLKILFDYVDVSVGDDPRLGTLYRVRASRTSSLKAAARAEKRLEDMGFGDAFVVRL